MKLKLEKSVIIKLLIVTGILLLAPYALPFSIEFVLMADIMGLEALLVFLVYQSRDVIRALWARLGQWQEHIVATVLLLASLYLFQPPVFFGHAAGSGLLLLLACSTLLALALWVPAIYLSSPGLIPRHQGYQ